MIPDIEPTERPADYLHRIGTVFAQFGADTRGLGLESVEGPLLVYSWSHGEHLGIHPSARDDPATAFHRFRALPVPEILQALDLVYNLHGQLTRAGWVAGDFYDFALMYDFKNQGLTVMDLDSYQLGAYRNNMGRMFGSSRFMAPEEYELGALIDQRTTYSSFHRAWLAART